MAEIAIGSDISLDANSGMNASYISGLTAGSALTAGWACYIDGAGAVLGANSSIAVASGSGIVAFAGFCVKDTAVGDAVTLFKTGARINYGTGLTPGMLCYSGSIVGLLESVGTLEGDEPIALVISTTDIQVLA